MFSDRFEEHQAESGHRVQRLGVGVGGEFLRGQGTWYRVEVLALHECDRITVEARESCSVTRASSLVFVSFFAMAKPHSVHAATR